MKNPFVLIFAHWLFTVILVETTETKFFPIFELENWPRFIHVVDLYTSNYGVLLKYQFRFTLHYYCLDDIHMWDQFLIKWNGMPLSIEK